MELSQKNLNALESVKKEIIEREEKEQNEIVKHTQQRKREYYLANGFKNRQEVIDHVKAGNKIVRTHESGYMRLCPERGENVVLNYRMSYDEHTDVPMGMETKYMTWDEFVTWTEWMDDVKTKELGYVEYWVKEK